MVFLTFSKTSIYSLVANRRGVGMIGGLENFPNINRGGEGVGIVRGLENFPNINSRVKGGDFPKFYTKGDEKCILLNSLKHGFKNYKYIMF